MFQIRELSKTAMAAAQERQNSLTKPPGSLGILETITIQLAGIFGEVPATLETKKIILFAGDHGIAESGVSAYPQEVTGQMMLNFANGGAAINALARHAGAEVIICDIGTKSRTEISGIRNIRIAEGTRDISKGPAMDREDAEKAIAVGHRETIMQINNGSRLIGLGDMGIGNTSIATAISAVMTGVNVAELTGPGTGIDDRQMKTKQEFIETAIKINKPDRLDGFDVLAKVGGFEFAGQAGAILACAESGIPVIIDGFISCASALIAKAIDPKSLDFMLASHLSAEPGHRLATESLGLTPMLYLNMRLGEGTGAVLAMTIIDAAIRVYHEMATFESAGIQKADGS